MVTCLAHLHVCDVHKIDRGHVHIHVVGKKRRPSMPSMIRDMDLEKVIAQDLPKLHQVLSESVERVKEVREHVSNLRTLMLSENHQPETGISLLELKYQMLLSYLINVVQLMMRKLDGQTINKSPPLYRIVEIRVVLEKIRPLDQKLKYQIDKLIQTATSGVASASDPLRLKPNPSNLVSKVVDSESSEDEGSSEPKLYMPPKVVSAPYEENPPIKQKSKILKQRTDLIDELREEVLDMPSEVKTSFVVGGIQKRKQLSIDRDLERFEENNMMRLSRKRKSMDTGRSNRQEMDDLAEFSDLRYLTDDVHLESYPVKQRTKKTLNKKKRSFQKKRK